MTDTLRKLLSVARSPWTLLLLAVLAALALAWKLNAGRGELAQLRAEAERAHLVSQGFLAAKQTAESKLDEAAAQLAGLAAELDRLRKSSPGLRVVYVTRAATKPVPAEGAPRPEEPGAPACLLAAGDLGTVMVSEIGLETRAGNRVVLGEAWAWRTTPSRARLFGGPWAVDLSEYAAEPTQAASGGPGWGGGVWASAGRGGAVAGPAVALPPLWGFEATLGGGLGSGGAWAAGGTLIWRGGR